MSKKMISLDSLQIQSFVTTPGKIMGGGRTSYGVCDETDYAVCDTEVDCAVTSPAECGTDPEFCV